MFGGAEVAQLRGARPGPTVGVLPGDSPDSANEFVRVRIATGMGIARNVIIISSAAAVIAISGGAGTLSEVAHCLQLGVPVVGLKSFDVSDEIVNPARLVKVDAIYGLPYDQLAQNPDAWPAVYQNPNYPNVWMFF